MSYNKYVCDSSFTLNPDTTLSVYSFNSEQFSLGFIQEHSTITWTFDIQELNKILLLAEKFELNSSITLNGFEFSIRKFGHQNRPDTIEFVAKYINTANKATQDYSVEIQDVPGTIKYVKDFIIQAQNFEIL